MGAGREARLAPGRPGPNDRLGAVRLEALNVGALHSQQATQLGADHLEQPLRIRIAGHERCDTPNSCLLLENSLDVCHRDQFSRARGCCVVRIAEPRSELTVISWVDPIPEVVELDRVENAIAF
jgi:hypothetical protein